ncbi:MAG: hypothetical protein JWP89_4046 [Schlesneria sp.]|nr:hypothetical protein [Schlesneria sp.]
MFWKYLLDSEFSQRSDIESQREELDELKKQLRGRSRSASDTKDLQEEIGKLKLYIAVIFRLLVSKGIVDRDELYELVEQIDEEDGRSDDSHSGKVLP